MTKRSWAAARQKIDEEGRCRSCGLTHGLEAAHIIPRSRIGPDGGAEDPLNVLPLCLFCHRKQHEGNLELLPIMRRDEQAFAVGLVGIEEALRRTTRAA